MADHEKIDIRKPPVGAVYSQHKQGVRGSCGWCGLAVEEKTRVRGFLKFWHDACDVERSIIEQPAMARHFVFKRDKGICADCGEDWSEMSIFRPAAPSRMAGDNPDPDRFSPGPKPGSWCYVYHRDGAPYVDLLVISLWHVDHKVPLWKVQHLPPLQRLEFFKLANLVTLCQRCHKRKSAQEEAEKAHLDRLSVAPPQDKPPKPKRNWPQRKFPKRLKR